MNREELGQLIYKASNIKGRFRLRSGANSDEYFDKYLFESDPELLLEIALALKTLIPPGVDAFAGLEMGGIPIATVLSQVTGIPTLFIRKKAKEYGTRKLAEGGEVHNRNIMIVEDIITSAGQTRESAKELRNSGAHIVGVLCVIDREEGGRVNLEGDNLTLYSLFTITEIKTIVSCR